MLSCCGLAPLISCCHTKRKEQDGAELQQFFHWCAGTILLFILGALSQNICCFDDNWWKEEAIPKFSPPFNKLLHRARTLPQWKCVSIQAYVLVVQQGKYRLPRILLSGSEGSSTTWPSFLTSNYTRVYKKPQSVILFSFHLLHSVA